MVDRQDIDALLVGALYGELTPADEARLAAHLESHPADRAALDDLKSARQAVKQSRIFEIQHEPPQAVSALLLQEAHRRVPVRARITDGREQSEGWFARLSRSFFAHPAMAAAAMLVVVVSVAGVVHMRKGGDEFASKEAPGATPSITATENAFEPAQGAAAPTPHEADRMVAANDAGVAAATGGAAGPSAEAGLAPTANAPAAAPAPPPPAPATKAPARSQIASNTTPTATVAPAPGKADAKNDPVTNWARGKLASAIQYARDNNCNEAAKIVLDIKAKAPAFYTDNVADNRDLKDCGAYGRRWLEQSEERAKKMSPAKSSNDAMH